MPATDPGTTRPQVSQSLAPQCAARAVRSLPEESETRLLRRCRQGESAAWDELFDRHYSAASRFIYQLGYQFTREDVEEICQEVFLTVVRNLRLFKGKSRFQTWLFRIATNKARDYRQRQNAAKRGGGQVPISLQADEPENGRSLDPPSRGPGPDAVLIHSENLALLGRALEALDASYQEVLALRYFADLSYDEIARSLNLHPKTVSSRLSKGLRKLAEAARRLMGREHLHAASV